MEKALKGDAQEQHEKYDLANMTSTCCTRVIIFFIFMVDLYLLPV